MPIRICVLYDSEEMAEILEAVIQGLGHAAITRPRASFDARDFGALYADAVCVELGWTGERPREMPVLEALRAEHRTATMPILACSSDVRTLRERRSDFERLRVLTLRKPFSLTELEGALLRLVDFVAASGATGFEPTPTLARQIENKELSPPAQPV